MPKPQDCKYTKTHEWVYVQNDIATIGISEYAQHEIGDIVFVELPKVGAAVSQGKNCGVIESVKAASDFYSPVSGTVTEANDAVANQPSLVNQSAQEEGWFCKVKLSNPAEINSLMDFSAYQEFQKTCVH